MVFREVAMRADRRGRSYRAHVLGEGRPLAV